MKASRVVSGSLIALALAGVLALPLLKRDADASAPADTADAPAAIVSVAPAINAPFSPRHWSPGRSALSMISVGTLSRLSRAARPRPPCPPPTIRQKG